MDTHISASPEQGHAGTDKKKLLVIGCGFAGLNLAKHIDKRLWDVTIIDRFNFHSFPPLFYQVASAGLDPGSISFPLRREMRSRRLRGCTFHLGEATRIDTDAKTVQTQYETLRYDTLVIAAGTTNNFFGNDDLQKSVYTLKSVPEAIRCRNDILARLERAAIEPDAGCRRRLLSFTIIGGGPAGVEIAGALGEMKRYILRREYPGIGIDEMSVTLVEGGNRLLQAMDEKASAHALEYMGHLMVDVRLGALMKSYEDDVITFTDGTQMYGGMVIWTAGVKGVPLAFAGTQPVMARGGRLEVDEFNRVAGLQDVYAVGDIASHSDERHPHGCPQVAQAAIQQGRRLAYNLNRPAGRRHPFVYKDKGSMATVGRNRAVASIPHPRLNIYGRPAWVAWMAIHLLSLLGMRNKLTVLINWVWGYFTYSSSLRLLILPTRLPLRRRWAPLDNHNHNHNHNHDE